MKKNIFTRILAIALVAMSIMAIAIPAMAASSTKYGLCPTDEFIYVRSAAKKQGDLYHLHNGEPVTATGTTKNGYSQISSPVNGWVLSTCLTTSPAWKNRYGSKTMNLESYAHMLAFQVDLNEIPGINISEDGTWGPETEAAVRTFQQMAGITVDGIAGTQTKYRLYNRTH